MASTRTGRMGDISGLLTPGDRRICPAGLARDDLRSLGSGSVPLLSTYPRRAALGLVAAALIATALPTTASAAVSCDAQPTHEIGQVQGSAAATPLSGQPVTVRGTVVGDVPGFSGFYLQDADGDDDAATSDGIFVFSPVAVDLGDTVVATGTAGEFSGQTQIDARTDAQVPQRGATVCGEGSADDLPDAAPLDLPAGDAERERLEGMLVEPVDELTVSEVFDLTSFGELTLSEGGLLVQPTELARPGPEAQAIAAENLRRRITLDDGVSARVSVTTRPYLTPDTPVRVGDELRLHRAAGARLRVQRLAAAAGRRHRGRRLRAAEHPARGARAGGRRPAGGRVQRAQLLPHLDRRQRPRRAERGGVRAAVRQDRGGHLGARRRGGDAAGDRGHRQHRVHPRQRRRRPRRPGGQAERGRRRRALGVRAAARRAVLRGPRRDPQRDHLPARRGGAGRRPGRSGRRAGLGQRPGADRPDVHRTGTRSPWWPTTSSPRASGTPATRRGQRGHR